MPIAFEQAEANEAAAATTVSVVLPAALKAGSTIVLGLSTFPPTDGTVQFSDSLGNPFTLRAGPTLTPNNGHDVRVASSINVVGGNDTVTVTLIGATVTSGLELYVHEYSGISSFDVSASNAGLGTVSVITSGFAATTGSNELLVAVCISGGTATAGANFTARSTFNNNFTADRVVTAPGSYQATGTNVSGSEWVIHLVAFKGL